MITFISTSALENSFMIFLIGISIGSIAWEIFRRKPYIKDVRKDVAY